MISTLIVVYLWDTPSSTISGKRVCPFFCFMVQWSLFRGTPDNKLCTHSDASHLDRICLGATGCVPLSLGKNEVPAVTGFAVEHMMEGCMVILTPIEGHAALKRSLGHHGVIEGGPCGRRLALNIRCHYLLKSKPGGLS